MHACFHKIIGSIGSFPLAPLFGVPRYHIHYKYDLFTCFSLPLTYNQLQTENLRLSYYSTLRTQSIPLRPKQDIGGCRTKRDY